MSLSVVINTRNMVKTLVRTLESVKDVANEIVVVDMMSDDETVSLAKKYTNKVFTFDKLLEFADPARNFALEKATQDWVLVLDADEEASDGLKVVIEKVISDEMESELKGDCYQVPRKNIIFDKWIKHTGWWPDYQLRLFRRGTVRWSDKVHTAPEATGKVVELPANGAAAIIHHNYQSIDQFIERLNRYTSLELNARPTSESVSAKDVVKSFSGEFCRRFFAEKGYQDGSHGVSLSLLQAMYETVVTLKGWQAAKFEDSKKPGESLTAVSQMRSDLAYWLADIHVRHTKGPLKMWWQLRRKWRF